MVDDGNGASAASVSLRPHHVEGVVVHIACAPFIGNLTVKIAPPLGLFAATMEPPCSLIIE